MNSTRNALVLATGNAKKRKELERLAGDRFLVRTLHDVGLAHLEIDESALTFAGNARIKAVAVWDALVAQRAVDDVRAVLADDSGLMVDALAGLPGVRSARFASDHHAGSGDDDNNTLLLAKLAGIADAQRTARFASHVCARLHDGTFLDEEGTVEGRIAHDRVGSGGFGYDPLFVPLEGGGRRMAELSADEKDAISHRGRAMRAILHRL